MIILVTSTLLGETPKNYAIEFVRVSFLFWLLKFRYVYIKPKKYIILHLNLYATNHVDLYLKVGFLVETISIFKIVHIVTVGLSYID